VAETGTAVPIGSVPSLAALQLDIGQEEAITSDSSAEDGVTSPEGEESADGTTTADTLSAPVPGLTPLLAGLIASDGRSRSAERGTSSTSLRESPGVTGHDTAGTTAGAKPTLGAPAAATGQPAGEAGGAAIPADSVAAKVEPGLPPELPSVRGGGEGLSFATQLARADSVARGEAPGASGPATSAGPQGPVVERVPVASVPVEIGLRSLAGVRSFEIRLAPQDLGRIDVQLDFHDEGRVDARLVVDRPETLAYLQRDAGQLHRALEQAGFRPSDTGVALSLRQDGADAGAGNRSQMGDGQGDRSQAGSSRYAHTASPDPVPEAQPARAAWARASGVDLRI
jgi:flagellar hook-length control protein FliK